MVGLLVDRVKAKICLKNAFPMLKLDKYTLRYTVTQSVFINSKSTMKTPEQWVKSVQS